MALQVRAASSRTLFFHFFVHPSAEQSWREQTRWMSSWRCGPCQHDALLAMLLSTFFCFCGEEELDGVDPLQEYSISS
jgi:hypothetical protein